MPAIPKSAGVSRRITMKNEAQLKIWLVQSAAARQARLRARERSMLFILLPGADRGVSAMLCGSWAMLSGASKINSYYRNSTRKTSWRYCLPLGAFPN